MSADPIVWEGSIDDGAADAPRRMRVTKLLAQSGVESFIVEVHTQDAQKRDAWLETDDYVDTGAAAWATVEAQWKELEELRRRASAREVLPELPPMFSDQRLESGAMRCKSGLVLGDLRKPLRCRLHDGHPGDHEQLGGHYRWMTTGAPPVGASVDDASEERAWPTKSELHEGAPSRPEVKVPGFYTPIPGVEMAALRAELTALGKHVEDVERRAYDTPTKAEAGAFGDTLDSLTRRVEHRATQSELDDFRKATELWQSQHAAQASAISTGLETPRKRVASRLDALENTSAGKAETLEAVRPLTEWQALDGRLADVEARIGQPGPLDELEQRIEKLERSDAEWEPMLDRRGKQIADRFDDLARTAREADLGISKRLDGAFAKLERDHEKLTRDDDRIGALELAHDSLEQRLLAEIERRFKTLVWFDSGAEYAQAVSNLVPGPLEVAGVGPFASSLSKSVMASSGTELLDLAKLKIPCGCIRGRTLSIRDCYLRIETPLEDDVDPNGVPPLEIREVGLTASSKRLLARMLVQSADVDEKGGAS